MSGKLFSRNEAIKIQAMVFDDLRSSNAKVYLLKREGQTKRFSVVLEVASGSFVSFDKFRDSMILSVATAAANFGDIQAQSSYIAYGEPDGAGSIDVYEISPEARDRIPPTETSPAWKFL